MATFNTSMLELSNPNPSHSSITDGFFGFTPFFIFTIFVIIICLLCIIVWILLACHYRLKYQIATLKQFNSIDSATLFHQIRRRPSTASDMNYHKDTDQGLSLDVSHSYNFHKEKTQSLDDATVSADHMHNLTVNRLHNLKSLSRPIVHEIISSNESILSYADLANHKSRDSKSISPKPFLNLNNLLMNQIQTKSAKISVPPPPLQKETKNNMKYLSVPQSISPRKKVKKSVEKTQQSYFERNEPNSGEKSMHSSSSSTSFMSSSGQMSASPSTSLYTKSSETNNKSGEEEISKDYCVRLDIIEDIVDKENVNMRNSMSFNTKNNIKHRKSEKFFNEKIKKSMTDLYEMSLEPSQTPLSSQADYEMSHSNQTMIVHSNEDSRLTNVLDEFANYQD